MKLKIFVKIFLLILIFAKPSFAQENLSNNSKNYEAKTIKKDNEIEIRLIPKNPPPKIEKTPKLIPNSNEEEDISDLEGEDSNADNQANSESEMVYEKNVENDGSNSADVKNIQTKKTNSVKEDSLKLWREEQRKLREERIKARKEEARKKYQAQKERSVIKEVENLNQKLNQNNSTKNNSANNAGGSMILPSQLNQNSGTITTNSNSTNTIGSGVASSSSTGSNAISNSNSSATTNTNSTPNRR